MALYDLCGKKPKTLWGSDGGADGFAWRLLIGGGMVVAGVALTVRGANRKNPVSALAGTSLAGGGGYLMHQCPTAGSKPPPST